MKKNLILIFLFFITKIWSQNSSSVFTYEYNQIPSSPGTGPCELVNLTWSQVIEKENPSNESAWSGGLGRLTTNDTQVWVCLEHYFTDSRCPSPPSDFACYVFNEANRTFSYWGRDSYLQLTKKIPAT